MEDCCYTAEDYEQMISYEPESTQIIQNVNLEVDREYLEEELYRLAYSTKEDIDDQQPLDGGYRVIQNITVNGVLDSSNVTEENNLSSFDGEGGFKDYSKSATKKRKRGSKDNNGNGSCRKKCKSDEDDIFCVESDEEGVCINQVSGDSVRSGKKKTKQKTNKRTLGEIVEDAGLSITDIKSFIAKETLTEIGDDSESEDIDEYYVISETSDASDDGDIDVNLVAGSKSTDDSTLSKILDGIPEDGSWDVSNSDIFGESNVSMPRFHNFMKKFKCLNCNERGHQASNCHQPKKQIKCVLCGDSGHLFRNCPDQLCFRCNQPGHSLRDCVEKNASFHDRCKRCYAKGHFEEKCPDIWRQFHWTVKEGEVIKKKEICKWDGLKSCYNCGKIGHFGNACRESRMDKYQMSCSPYVSQYDRKQNTSLKECHSRKKGEKPSKKRQLSGQSPRTPDRESHHLINNNSSKHHPGRNMSINRADGSIDSPICISDLFKDSWKNTPHHDHPLRDISKSRNKKLTNGVAQNVTGNFDNSYDDFRVSLPKQNIKPLMNVTFHSTESLNNSSLLKSIDSNKRRKASKLRDPEDFPRDHDDSAYGNAQKHKRNSSINISPITPRNGLLHMLETSYDKNSAMVEDAPYFDELSSCGELRDSYYGKKEMKIAKRKRLRKEKQEQKKLKQQMAKDSQPHSFKQWWMNSSSLSDNHQPETSTPVVSSSANDNIDKQNNSAKKSSRKTRRVQHVTEKVKLISYKPLNNADHQPHNNQQQKQQSFQTTPRGFKLSIFQ